MAGNKMLIGDVINRDELSSLIVAELKELGIKFRKEKKSKGVQEKCCKRIFRIPLASLEQTDVVLANGGIVQIPKFVSDACQRILEQVDTEGLFRKAGSANRQKDIRISLEAGLPLGRSHHVIDVANVLKLFFRELPEPLLPPYIQEPLLRSLLTGERGIKPLLMCCLLLPVLNVNTLAFFMQFLHTVSLCAHQNKMTIENLAILFTPGLMPLSDIGGIRFTNHVKVVRLLIEQSNMIGILPETVVEKLQQTTKTPNETDKKKKKRRSGSLTRMFNGLRKIVGVIGSSENLDRTPDNQTATPCLNKSAKKRKMADVAAFSAKKKKDLMAMFPENGGLLPSTPYCEKEVKKTRLSLGGRKTVKSNSNPGSSGSSMERRWSIVGPSWTRKKNSQEEAKKKEELKPLTPVVSMPCIAHVDRQKADSPESTDMESNKSLDVLETTVAPDYDYVRISKSEYEAIKERVSAIETRISQEFGSVKKSILLSSPSDLENSLTGPERVLNKFEKTVEETGNITSPSTDQLAKRLSRELKIRRSEDHKIIRSPSARKIGTMRRRSRENVKITRNKTWHISNSQLKDLNQPNPGSVAIIGTNSFYPKSNLKRGRPNTVFTGLHQPGSVTKMDIDDNTKENFVHEQENWTAGELFFNNNNKIPSTRRSVGFSEQRTFNTPSNKRKSGGATPTNVTSIYVTRINLDEAKTPMLPPRSVSKKPIVSKASNSTTKSIQKNSDNLQNKMPASQPDDGAHGRASIARLRSQNAGMVMAKAKLFDELGNEADNKLKNIRLTEQQQRRKSSIFANKTNAHSDANNCYLVPYKNLIANMPKDRMTDLNGKAPRRKASSRNSPGCNRKRLQKLNSNRNTMESIVNEIGSNYDSNKIVDSVQHGVNAKRLITDSPYRNTPKIKKSLQINSPRRFVKTPRGQTANAIRKTPLKASTVGQRCSPRLKLQSESKYLT